MANLGEYFDPMKIAPWQGDESIPPVHLSVSETKSQFSDFARSKGIALPSDLKIDGEIHPFSTNGKAGDDAGRYKLFADGMGGWIKDHRAGGVTHFWRANIGRAWTVEEERAHHLHMEAAKRQAEEERQRQYADAAAKAKTIFKAARPVGGDHPYLVRKGISPEPETMRELTDHEVLHQFFERPGCKDKATGEWKPLVGRLLILPMRDEANDITTLQFIDEFGRKSNFDGGRAKSSFWQAQALPFGDGAGSTIAVGEGAATVLSVREATGFFVVAAFSCGNLKAVAEMVKRLFPAARLVILGDKNKDEKSNSETQANEAGHAVGAAVAIPDFGDRRSEGATDFNDLAVLAGPAEVKRQIGAVFLWPAPQPLLIKIPPEPYPLDALPEVMRLAVEEVWGFVQAPLSMVATSALTGVAVTTQGHVDAQRVEGLRGPSSLSTLTIADSGERKSTLDEYFVGVIREYESELREEAKEALVAFASEMDIYDTTLAGLRDSLRDAVKKGRPVEELEGRIRALKKPDEPKIRKYLYDDVTPEELGYSMYKRWRIAALISAEGGSALGGHGMKPENITRALSRFNQLWSGETIDVARRTSESYILEGARFSIGLQVQESVWRAFFESTGELARGSGFLARFLLAWPESTQGFRPFKYAPAGWPSLRKLRGRMRELLEMKINFRTDDEGNETDIPEPYLLTMSPDAETAWIHFYNVIEESIRPNGEAQDVSDVASKTADNAARIAAVFHCLIFGPTGSISVETFNSAARIAAWHLHEARRFFGELALPPTRLGAVRLDSWLIDYCRQQQVTKVSRREAQRLGPVRDGDRLNAAIAELDGHDRVRVERLGKHLDIHVNPALLA